MVGKSLCPRRLNGGGTSPGRTRLSGEFPDLQGKYRELLENRPPLEEDGRRFPIPSTGLAKNPLRSGSGNRFTRTGNSFRGAGRPGRRNRLQAGANEPTNLNPALGRGMRLRPIQEGPAARQVADFVSDFVRPTFGTLRGARSTDLMAIRLSKIRDHVLADWVRAVSPRVFPWYL